MASGFRHTTRIFAPIIISFLMMMALWCAPIAAAGQSESRLPPFDLDVLEGFVWSTTDVYLAPGQKLVITNRDVARHTFTVTEWGVDLNLPSLMPQEITVPGDVVIGDQYEFFSSVPGDREGGLTGSITIVTEEEIVAGSLLVPDLINDNPEARVRIETRDDFTFQPAIATVGPGTILEIVNTGVISHHFSVEAWDVNQTIAPGKMVLVRVPDDVQVGSSIDFSCSVPGHMQQGMVGVLRVTGNPNEITTVIRTSDGGTERPIDLRPFVPAAEALGSGWTQLRAGSSESILGLKDLNSEVFPYSGLGAVYVGPDGARVTIVVLPLRTDQIPMSQVNDAVRVVQDAMASTWSVDRIASAAWRSVSPPNGCTVSERVSGIVPVITLAGGVTSCQLSGVGLALFVSVEGDYQGRDGVLASDLVVTQVIAGDIVLREGDE